MERKLGTFGLDDFYAGQKRNRPNFWDAVSEVKTASSSPCTSCCEPPGHKRAGCDARTQPDAGKESGIWGQGLPSAHNQEVAEKYTLKNGIMDKAVRNRILIHRHGTG